MLTAQVRLAYKGTPSPIHGQSALSRLGKIQIDYKNSTLTIIR